MPEERKLVEGDRIYIDNTNVVYKIASISYSGGKIVCVSVYYVDPSTQEEKIVPVNPESVRPF